MTGEAPELTAQVLRQPEPGRLYTYVRGASYFELALFSGLLIVWAFPGLDQATFAFGLAHGIGFVCLAILIWIAAVRHETPYWLLAATLTPFGPVGSVIGIAHLDRRQHEGHGRPLALPRPLGQGELRQELGQVELQRLRGQERLS